MAVNFILYREKKYTEQEIGSMEMQMGTKFSPKKRKSYTAVGGTPFLDTQYTVFGETESGLDVIDKIAKAAGDGNNRPNTDIRMKIEVIK